MLYRPWASIATGLESPSAKRGKRERLTGDAQVYMPWLLNGASPQTLEAILGNFPPPLLAAYREQWAPRYAALTIWPSAGAEAGAGAAHA